jgi:uncharacterized protein YsxB (DUF464 family)
VIRVYAVQDELDSEGGCTLIITGHASEKVCAGASALWATMLLGYAEMAKLYPKQIAFQKVTKKKPTARR